jgi:hypothetical protein
MRCMRDTGILKHGSTAARPFHQSAHRCGPASVLRDFTVTNRLVESSRNSIIGLSGADWIVTTGEGGVSANSIR